MGVFKKSSLLGSFFLWLILIHTQVVANVTPLTAEKAFRVSLVTHQAKQVNMVWNIAPHYYLYVKHMHIEVSPKASASIHYPKGQLKKDANGKPYEAYAGIVEIPVTLSTDEQSVTFAIDYQGCSSDGFCYPPMHKTLQMNLLTQSVSKAPPAVKVSKPAQTFFSLLTDQNGVLALFQNHNMAFMLIMFLVLGLLLAFTPCVWPMIPILTGIIVGQKQTVNTKKAFFLSLSYVMGMAITYAIAGLIAAWMGSSLQAWLQTPWALLGVSGLFVLLSLSLFGLYDLSVPNAWQNRINQMSNRLEGGTYIGVFFMGVLSTLVVSPCVTAPLVGVLMYIGQTGSLVLGASALFVMGIGMGIPLLVIGVSAGKWLPKSGPWMEALKKMVGLLMLSMAVWLLSRVLPAAMIRMLWGILVIFLAIFLGSYLPRIIGKHIFHRSLGFLVGLSGMLIMFGGKMPDTLDWMKINHRATTSFRVVHDVSDLGRALSDARQQHKPVILDFYADWCASCVSMDKKVFEAPAIQQSLSRYVLLRADLSANTAADEALLKQFDVIAPPTVIFFDHQGQEVNSNRIVGEVNATEFLARLEE